MHVVSRHTAVQDILIHTTQQCIHVHLPTVKNRLPSLTIMSYELLILCVIISQLHYFPNSHLQLLHGSSMRDFCIGVINTRHYCLYMIFKPHFRIKAGLARSSHSLCGPCQQCMLSTCSHSILHHSRLRHAASCTDAM